MSCKFDKDIIQKYIDNTIDPLELLVLKEHLKVCEDCKFELELMSKLDKSMYDYFGSLPGDSMLDEFSISVLNQCYKASKTDSLKAGISKVWNFNKIVASSTVRYTSYLPGSKLVSNTAKKAGSGINKALRSYVKSSFRKLIESAVK